MWIRKPAKKGKNTGSSDFGELLKPAVPAPSSGVPP